MMNRTLCMILTGFLVLGLSASSIAGKARTKSGSYNTVAGDLDVNDPSLEGEFSNSVTFRPRTTERLVSIRIEDRSGLPTRALVVQSKTGPNGSYRVLEEEICGRSTAPIRIARGLNVRVVAQDGPCSDGTTAAATSGTVTATFRAGRD